MLKLRSGVEYTSSLKNCKDIAFGRGMYEIAHDTEKKVILNSNNIVYSTSPKLDAVDFKEQKFLKLPDANKYFKQMNVRDYDDGKYKIKCFTETETQFWFKNDIDLEN